MTSSESAASVNVTSYWRQLLRTAEYYRSTAFLAEPVSLGKSLVVGGKEYICIQAYYKHDKSHAVNALLVTNRFG